jgi:hypothetical protein
VPDAELRKITVDYTIEFARVLHGGSSDAAFSFLSGSGADPAGHLLLLDICPVFRVLFPNQVIRADDLARAMVETPVRGTEKRGGLILENRDIRAMVVHPHV